jgi:hypothetical protein
MQPGEFVQGLTSVCRDAAVTDCVATFESPPGRRPSSSLVEMSNWFLGLQAKDREFVVRAMQAVADSTLFGVACVIDGVRTIETQSPKSEFTVTAARDGLVSVVSPSDEFLHDLYRSQAWPGA